MCLEGNFKIFESGNNTSFDITGNGNVTAHFVLKSSIGQNQNKLCYLCYMFVRAIELGCWQESHKKLANESRT